MNSSNSGVMSIVRLRWRGSILIRGRHVSDKDPLGAGLPLWQQTGFENRHAAPTVDGGRLMVRSMAVND
jgi:hypothetical protein